MKTMKTLLSASLALTALSGCQPETEKPNIQHFYTHRSTGLETVVL